MTVIINLSVPNNPCFGDFAITRDTFHQTSDSHWCGPSQNYFRRWNQPDRRTFKALMLARMLYPWVHTFLRYICCKWRTPFFSQDLNYFDNKIPKAILSSTTSHCPRRTGKYADSDGISGLTILADPADAFEHFINYLSECVLPAPYITGYHKQILSIPLFPSCPTQSNIL